MIKYLHNLLILFFLCFASISQAQNASESYNHELLHSTISALDSDENFVKKPPVKKKVNSYFFVLPTIISSEHGHQHNDISQSDFISFDQVADFNCSGGFCMDRSHFHKKGITTKKQLFDYFIRMSC